MGTFAQFVPATTAAQESFNTILAQYEALGRPSFMESALETLLQNIAAGQIAGILPAFIDAAKSAGLPKGTYIFIYTDEEQAFRPAKSKAAKSSSSDSPTNRNGKTILQVKLTDGQAFEKLTSAAEALGLPDEKRLGVNSATLWKNLREASLTQKVSEIMFADHVSAETRLLFKK